MDGGRKGRRKGGGRKGGREGGREGGRKEGRNTRASNVISQESYLRNIMYVFASLTWHIILSSTAQEAKESAKKKYSQLTVYALGFSQ